MLDFYGNSISYYEYSFSGGGAARSGCELTLCVRDGSQGYISVTSRNIDLVIWVKSHFLPKMLQNAGL